MDMAAKSATGTGDANCCGGYLFFLIGDGDRDVAEERRVLERLGNIPKVVFDMFSQIYSGLTPAGCYVANISQKGNRVPEPVITNSVFEKVIL